MIELSWQSALNSPYERFKYISDSGKFSDLTISSLSRKLFQVHKLVLSVHSKVFERMFYGSIEYDESSPFHIAEDDETLQWIINYMYKNNALMNSRTNAGIIYQFAHQWQMDLLLVRCGKYLESTVNETNAKQIMEFACLYHDEKLIECCLGFFGKLQHKLILEEVADLSREAFGKVISHGGNWCGESQIFKSAYRWAEQRLINRDEDITGSSLRKELGDILFKIRYLVMTPKEFISNVLCTNILTSEESVSILLRLTNSDASLPDYICLTDVRRDHNEQKSFVHSVCLFKKSNCNYKTLFSHWNIHNSEQIMSLGCSDNLIIRCIRMRSECFPGTWNLVIKTEKGTTISVSNESGPPWYFTNAILLSGVKYLINIFGRGGRYCHTSGLFDTNSNGTFLTGESTKCGVVVEFCVC